MANEIIPAPADDSLKTWGWVRYILHLIVAVAAVVPGAYVSIGLLLIALVMDLVKRDDAARTDDGALADRHIGENGRAGADRRALLDDGVLDLPVIRGLQIPRGRRRPRVGVVDEDHAVADEDLVLDGHAFADEGVAGDLAAPPDAGVLLDLDEGADLGFVADRAARTTLPEGSEHLHWLTDQMRAAGLILRNDDRGDPTTQISPPLVITRDECERVVSILAACFDELGRKLGTVGTLHAVAAGGNGVAKTA